MEHKDREIERLGTQIFSKNNELKSTIESFEKRVNDLHDEK